MLKNPILKIIHVRSFERRKVTQNVRLPYWGRHRNLVIECTAREMVTKMLLASCWPAIKSRLKTYVLIFNTNSWDGQICPHYITGVYKIQQRLCIRSRTGLPQTTSLPFLSAKTLHTRLETVILSYRVLILNATGNIVLDILDHFYGQN